HLLVPRAKPRRNGQSAIAVAARSRICSRDQLVCNFGHRADHHNRLQALGATSSDNACCTMNGRCIFDGGPAELHHNQFLHAGTATGSSLPNETSSSAFSSAAPAAPRIVLCESTVNFQSSNVQGRRRPTVA